jgi:hypothetical protein
MRRTIDLFSSRSAKHKRAIAHLFDAQWYLGHNPNVADNGIAPIDHYVRYGWRERRSPNECFDSVWYLSIYPDVAAAQMDPLLHYVRFGRGEGRKPSLAFDPEAYLVANPDVPQTGVDPLHHYLRHGRQEGRRWGPIKSIQGEPHLILSRGLQMGEVNERLSIAFSRRWQ